MTLAIGLVNPEGIVMAADSRQSYRHAAVRIGSDSAIKVFELTDTMVAATSGYAFLRPQNAASNQNISTLVEDLKPTLAPNSTVQQVATALHAHFSTIYAQHIVHVPAEAVAGGTTAIQFIIAGYDPGSRVGELFECSVPGPAPVAAVRTSNNAGPWWIGQNDVAARVFNGFDPRIGKLFKTEEIRRRGPWKGLEDVEFATLEWVAWYNHERLLEPLGYVPPAEFEQAYHARQAAPDGVAVLT